MSRRILVAHPSAELYGSDRMLLESVRALVADRCGVTVAVPSEGPLVGVLRAAGADVVLVDTVVLRKSSWTPAGLLRLALVLVRAVPRMVRLVRQVQPDLVYVNTLTLPAWLLAARLSGRPVVCHVHEAEQGLPRPIAVALHAPLLLAHRVLINSTSALSVVCAVLPRLRPKLRLLYNGVAGPEQEPRAPRAALTGPTQLVLIGRVAPRKGTDVALGALQVLRARGQDVRLDLVGDVFPGYEWYAAQLEAWVVEHELAEVVHFVGFEADVWPRLAASDIVLMPSRVEPFGNSAVEAALAQRPLVASAVQGLQEIVEHGRTGLLVRPDDPLALADAAQELIQDWPRAHALALAARRDALRRFGTKEYARGLLRSLVECGLPSSGPRLPGPEQTRAAQQS